MSTWYLVLALFVCMKPLAITKLLLIIASTISKQNMMIRIDWTQLGMGRERVNESLWIGNVLMCEFMCKTLYLQAINVFANTQNKITDQFHFKSSSFHWISISSNSEIEKVYRWQAKEGEKKLPTVNKSNIPSHMLMSVLLCQCFVTLGWRTLTSSMHVYYKFMRSKIGDTLEQNH